MNFMRKDLVGFIHEFMSIDKAGLKEFEAGLHSMLDSVLSGDSEEFQKNLIAEFLKKSFGHKCNVRGKVDLVIYNDGKPQVFFEVKSIENKVEFVKNTHPLSPIFARDGEILLPLRGSKVSEAIHKHCHSDRSEASEESQQNRDISFSTKTQYDKVDISAFSKPQYDKKDSPSLACGDSKNSPSLANGDRGWVDSIPAFNADMPQGGEWQGIDNAVALQGKKERINKIDLTEKNINKIRYEAGTVECIPFAEGQSFDFEIGNDTFTYTIKKWACNEFNHSELHFIALSSKKLGFMFECDLAQFDEKFDEWLANNLNKETTQGSGVWNMEQNDPDPFMKELNLQGLPYIVVEFDANGNTKVLEDGRKI